MIENAENSVISVNGNFAALCPKEIIQLAKNIDQAGKAYDDAFKQLKTGSGNLLNQAESLRKLGVKNTKDLSGGVLKDIPTETAET